MNERVHFIVAVLPQAHLEYVAGYKDTYQVAKDLSTAAQKSAIYCYKLSSKEKH